MTKTCTRCGNEKPLNGFHKQKTTKDGLKYECKVCVSEKGRAYRSANEEKVKESKKIYYESNKDKIAVYRKDYYEKNKEKSIVRATEWNRNNKEKRAKTYKKYYKSNKNKIVEKGVELAKKRRLNDPEFRLLGNLRSRLYKAINRNTKATTTKKLIGCTTKELKIHLENQFTEGMSWDNYGYHGWHIDHIIPCASFDMLDPEQQRECFHYTNLQPLWGKDNLQKGDKL